MPLPANNKNPNVGLHCNDSCEVMQTKKNSLPRFRQPARKQVRKLNFLNRNRIKSKHANTVRQILTEFCAKFGDDWSFREETYMEIHNGH